MSALRERVGAALHPRTLITILITLVLVMGEWRYGIVGGYEKLALTLGTCVLCEVALSYFLLGKRPATIQSAYITGVSLTMLLRPAGGLVWPFVVGALLGIGSKYVLRYRGRHLWNPSNFAIAAILLLAPNRVAILSHEFGNDVAGNAVIWVFGILIASRAKILHVSLTYVACFLALSWLRSMATSTSFLTEAAPLTGPMYQLMVFFMLTDPRTTVSTVRGRVITVALIAVGEALIRVANDYDVPGALALAPAPTIFALAIIGPLALAIDLYRKRPSPVPARAAAPATA